MHPKSSLLRAPGHTFPQKLQKWSLPKCMVCTMFSVHLAGCSGSLCRLHAKKTHFNIMVSTFFCLGDARERKKSVHWVTQASPKTPKAAQSDAPGLPKCIQKATLGLYGVPRVPPEVSGAHPSRKSHKNDTENHSPIKNDG